jgi:hypothetical protein
VEQPGQGGAVATAPAVPGSLLPIACRRELDDAIREARARARGRGFAVTLRIDFPGSLPWSAAVTAGSAWKIGTEHVGAEERRS